MPKKEDDCYQCVLDMTGSFYTLNLSMEAIIQILPLQQELYRLKLTAKWRINLFFFKISIFLICYSIPTLSLCLSLSLSVSLSLCLCLCLCLCLSLSLSLSFSPSLCLSQKALNTIAVGRRIWRECSDKNKATGLIISKYVNKAIEP